MKKKQEFFIDKFLEERVAYHPTKNYRFDKICTIVRDALTEEWSLHDDRGKISTLEREKNAIIGKEEAV
ncbi:MAG: hypothetical protein RR472_06300, partial [Anaerovoracaceae bacterium]